jgi:hypothetical protein
VYEQDTSEAGGLGRARRMVIDFRALSIFDES